ncbi:MAG TPA: alpha/beta fold hydrolase [Acidimicrobiales bacterium]|nr:alpha/beta fold hydrolase [Acidimicrobiales bacterium]
MNFAQPARALAQVVPFGRQATPASAARAGALPILFLHGWGVGPHAYAAPIDRLRAFGFDVFAPAQPGFGGAAALDDDDCNFAGYARWAASYLDAQGVDGPVTVVGHSFGGGVAVQLAHDLPERVVALVLCNAAGGFPWAGGTQPPAIADRPLWEWARVLGADLLATPTLTRILPAVLGEAVPNLVSNPLAMWKVGEFVRRAHLLEEIAAVGRRRLPITVVWSDRDRLVPHWGFSALCEAAGVEGEVVPGNHCWLIAEPHRFGDLVLRAVVDAGVLQSAKAATG